MLVHVGDMKDAVRHGLIRRPRCHPAVLPPPSCVGSIFGMVRAEFFVSSQTTSHRSDEDCFELRHLFTTEPLTDHGMECLDWPQIQGHPWS